MGKKDKKIAGKKRSKEEEEEEKEEEEEEEEEKPKKAANPAPKGNSNLKAASGPTSLTCSRRVGHDGWGTWTRISLRLSACGRRRAVPPTGTAPCSGNLTRTPSPS